MNIRILAVSALALSLLAPAAFAGNSLGNYNTLPGSEDSAGQKDFLVNHVNLGNTQGFTATVNVDGVRNFNTGDFIDETNAERSQRSSR